MEDGEAVIAAVLTHVQAAIQAIGYDTRLRSMRAAEFVLVEVLVQQDWLVIKFTVKTTCRQTFTLMVREPLRDFCQAWMDIPLRVAGRVGIWMDGFQASIYSGTDRATWRAGK